MIKKYTNCVWRSVNNIYRICIYFNTTTVHVDEFNKMIRFTICGSDGGFYTVSNTASIKCFVVGNPGFFVSIQSTKEGVCQMHNYIRDMLIDVYIYIYI